jgi:isochorismate pyruvate lyase
MGRPVAQDERTRIRAEIDRIDRELLRLLSCRWHRIDAMTRTKAYPEDAHDPIRSRQILDGISQRAAQSDLPVDVAVQIWSLLLDLSVAYQRDRIVAAFSDARPDEEHPLRLRGRMPARPPAGE